MKDYLAEDLRRLPEVKKSQKNFNVEFFEKALTKIANETDYYVIDNIIEIEDLQFSIMKIVINDVDFVYRTTKFFYAVDVVEENCKKGLVDKKCAVFLDTTDEEFTKKLSAFKMILVLDR